MYNLYDLRYSQSTVYMNGECMYLCGNIAGNEGGRSADYFSLRFMCSAVKFSRDKTDDVTITRKRVRYPRV